MLTLENWHKVCRDRADVECRAGGGPVLNDTNAAPLDKGAHICESCVHRIWHHLGNNCYVYKFRLERRENDRSRLKKTT